MPCAFQYSDEGKKDMIVYNIIYNYTLAPSNSFNKISEQSKKDRNILSLKLQIDNAILEQKAIQKGLNYIPRIN